VEVTDAGRPEQQREQREQREQRVRPSAAPAPRPAAAPPRAAASVVVRSPAAPAAESRCRVEVERLNASFGAVRAVRDVSMGFRDHEVTAIIGPSGCGKSTFLRTLNRMHELIPTAAMGGEVRLDGVDIYAPGSRPSLMRLRIGMVFQKPNPFPTMSIGENVLSGLKLAGIPCRDKAETMERNLIRAGVWSEVKDRLNAPAGALSGGQQQRLCIARSLAVSPRVLLMDEPCSALDPSSTMRIEETIRDISSQSRS
jgi:phosphate transport system ATP-binding protein